MTLFLCNSCGEGTHDDNQENQGCTEPKCDGAYRRCM